MPVLSIGNVALNKVTWPVAFAMRKAADRYPEFQKIIAQAAKNHKKEEKVVIENCAKVCSAVAIGLVYYNTRKSPDQQRAELLKERLEKLGQEVRELEQQLPPQIVRNEQAKK